MPDKSFYMTHRVMGCSIKELLHSLPAATSYRSFLVKQCGDQSENLQVDFLQDGITIVAHKEADRKIGLLVLPVLSVNFYFSELWDEFSRQGFMRRFDMYTQRGGG